jgi:hypothetical protein
MNILEADLVIPWRGTLAGAARLQVCIVCIQPLVSYTISRSHPP